MIANAGGAIEQVAGTIDALKFSGTVDFTPARVFKADVDGNPTEVKPGSVGDANYSPLVRIGASGPVYNAPIVASGSAPHDTTNHTDTLDRVVAINTIDAKHPTVTLVLARGFTNGQPIAYISTDASVDAPAAIERSTYAPRLKKLTAGAIPIDVLFNGAKQGIAFAARQGRLDANATARNVATLGSPLNIQATFPATEQRGERLQPDVERLRAVWTKAAIADGKEQVLRSDAHGRGSCNEWIYHGSRRQAVRLGRNHRQLPRRRIRKHASVDFARCARVATQAAATDARIC